MPEPDSTVTPAPSDRPISPLPSEPTSPAVPAEAPAQPIRIQVLLNAFALDGPGRLVVSLAEQWGKMEGVSVRVAALTRSGPLRKVLADMGVATEAIEARGAALLASARSWASTAGRLAPPDILHTHLARPDLIGPFLASRLGHPRLVSTNHGLHAWREKGRLAGMVYSRLFRWRQGRFDRIVAVSRAVADELIRAGIRRRRVTVIPNGIDPVVFRPAPGIEKREVRRLLDLDPDAAFLIVMVGNLIPLKGHEYLIRALPWILKQNPAVRAVIIGEGPLDDSLRTLAAQLGVEHAIKRISPLTTLLPRVIAGADTLVHPSLTESFGLVVAEAQACGLPVVASKVGGPAEIVVDGETGYLVPSGDPEALAAAVNNLATNPEVVREMGAAGRQRVLQLYDIRRCAAEYIALFRQLTQSPRGAGEAP